MSDHLFDSGTKIISEIFHLKKKIRKSRDRV